jgi:hypothetical protein
MKRSALLLSMTLPLAGLSSQAVSASSDPHERFPTTIALPPDGEYPEGIARNGKTLYVTSVTTGAVYRARIGDDTFEPFLAAGSDGRTNAVGVKARGAQVVVAGGPSGKVFVYRTDGSLQAVASSGGDGSFLNDLAIVGRYAYVTDSFQPIIWRVDLRAKGDVALEPWLDVSATIPYVAGSFNLNGIVAGRGALVTVNSTTGALFRIGLSDGAVSQVDTGGATFVNGDGLVLTGCTLRVVRNAVRTIDTVQLDRTLSSGDVEAGSPNDALAFPTTAAAFGNGLWVVNSQFDRGGPAGPGTPVRPFTVTFVPNR